MEYIIVENGIIVEHACGSTKPENAIEVPSGFGGYVGAPLAALKADLSGMKPLSQQISEGVTELPEGYKVNDADNEFIQMEQEEIDAKYPVKTFAVEGSFDGVEVQKTFDRFGNFGYWPQDGQVEMKTAQPSKAHKATKGKWVFDIDKGKELKLSELSDAYTTATEDAHCMSKLGFEIDADENARSAITDLIDKGEGVDFCDYHNKFHPVSVDGLKTMKAEVVDHMNGLKAKKWAYRDAINTATTEKELTAISIRFES